MTIHQRAGAVFTRDAEAETIEASLASDAPYQREDYAEILRCARESVDLSRARDGLVLLLHHDRHRIAGRVHNIHADGRRVRGVLSFFDTADGREARAMVRAGHRELSVGYTIDEFKRGPNGEVIATKWTLLEVSVVAIPADAGIGVARSSSMEHVNQGAGQAGADSQGQEASTISQAMTRSQRRQVGLQGREEQERIESINGTARQYGKWLRPDDASDAIARGLTAEQFNGIIMERMQSGATDAGSLIGGHPSERANPFAGFSLVRYVQSVLDPAAYMRSAGLEREATRELARQAPIGLEGSMVPLAAIFPVAGQRDMSAGSSSLGGSFVQTSILSDGMIDALRARSVVVRLGAKLLPGLRDPIALPKKTAATAAGSWLTETGTANATDVSTGQVTLSPKRISAYVVVSRQLMMTSTPVAIEQMIGTDLRQTLEQELDRVAINGTGSSNQPRGVRNAVGVGSVVGGTNGAQLAWQHILDLEASLENSDAMTDLLTAGYAINGKTRSWLKRTMKVSGQPGGIIMGETPPDDAGIVNLNGYRALTSSKLPSNLTKGTSSGVCSSLVFGCWSNMVIGQFGPGVEILIDPYSLATTGQVRITANLFADVAVRNGASFAVMDDALTV